MTARTRLLALSALLLGALLVIYSNHWHNAFHFDDRHTIEENVFVRSLRNVPRFFADSTTFSTLPSNRSYRPVVSTTLALDYAVAQAVTGDGYDTFAYHASTFALFLLQGVLMYAVFRKILDGLCAPGARDGTAFVATALYMVHPAAAETINYVIARSDSLSTLCVMLAFAMYLHGSALRRLHLYLLPIVVGCLAKPTALMFVPMLLAYQVLFEERRAFMARGWLRDGVLRRVLMRLLPSLLVAGLLVGWLRRMESASWQPGGGPAFNYLITQPWVMLHYLANFLVPLHFSADTDWQPFTALSDPRCLAGLLFLAALLAAIALTSRAERWRPVSFGLAWFLLALVPTSVVPLAEVTNDHRVFFPYVGLALAVVWTLRLLALGLWPAAQRLPAGALALLVALPLGALGWRTHERNAVWATEESLWRDVTLQSPNNARGLMNYGHALMRQGQLAQAEAYFARGLALNPNYPILNWNMAVVKGRLGDEATAQTYWDKALQLAPQDAALHADYAAFLRSRGRSDEALAHLQTSLALVDSNIDARRALMALLREAGRLEELQVAASRTLELLPGDAEALRDLERAQSGKSALQLAQEASTGFTTPEQWLNLSLLHYQAGQFEPCIDAARSALALRPGYAAAWNNICAAENALGRFTEGRQAGEEAVRLDPANALARRNLDWSLQNLPGR